MQINNEHSEIRLFCDLDHTLIYSHRISIGADKVVVEYLNGKEQSFMARNTYEFFRSQNFLSLIPVTTRSKLQYERITVFQEELFCKYALVCNGGVLLIDGVEDTDWYKESLSLISQEMHELKTMQEHVRRLSPTSLIHDVCGLYFYIKHDSPAAFAEELNRVVQSRNISVFHDRHKVYCLPTILNKGTAIERFARKFGNTLSIAAGDSNFDIPMLARADIRIIPSDLESQFPAEDTIIISDFVFSDGICGYLNTIAKRGTHQHE